MTDPTFSPTPRRVLVTGVTGQDGYYLAAQLLDEGARVYGLARARDARDADNAGAAPGVHILEGDMRDARSLRCAIDAAEPDEIYNLAASTFVPGSWQNAALVEEINAGGVESLANAIVQCGAPMRLCHASSAEIFGPPTGRPQREDDALTPVSPYGAAKARAHRCVAELRERSGVFACSAILFNHESPRRPARFVTRKITLAAARIARGLQGDVVLGNLDAARDWGYAPEYMGAMRAMVRGNVARDYVVATGRACTVSEFARLAFARVGLDWRQHVVSDGEFSRESDNLARIGDASRIARDLGWRAVTTVEELVVIMVDADLASLDVRGQIPKT